MGTVRAGRVGAVTTIGRRVLGGLVAGGRVTVIDGGFGHAAFTACRQADDNLAKLLCRQTSASLPPSIMLMQCAMYSERQTERIASFCDSVTRRAYPEPALNASARPAPANRRAAARDE